MIVEVTGCKVALTDVDNFDRFEVRTGYLADLDQLLRSTGAGYALSLDAVISTEWISKEARAMGIANPTWQARYFDMVSFARSNRWLLDNDTGIRAHVEMNRQEVKSVTGSAAGFGDI